MKVFLDANVIISVLNKEYPLFTYSSRILSLADSKHFELFTTPLSLAISFYFSSKKSGTQKAEEKLQILKQKLKLAIVNGQVVEKALSNKAVHNFEDGMQYYAAIHEGCRCIVTENQRDFYFSNIEILSCREFLEKYIFPVT